MTLEGSISVIYLSAGTPYHLYQDRQRNIIFKRSESKIELAISKIKTSLTDVYIIEKRIEK